MIWFKLRWENSTIFYKSRQRDGIVIDNPAWLQHPIIWALCWFLDSQMVRHHPSFDSAQTAECSLHRRHNKFKCRLKRMTALAESEPHCSVMWRMAKQGKHLIALAKPSSLGKNLNFDKTPNKIDIYEPYNGTLKSTLAWCAISCWWRSSWPFKNISRYLVKYHP